MRLLITGACGFVGAELALALQEQLSGLQITGIDNLSRRGSWRHLKRLEQRGIRVPMATSASPRIWRVPNPRIG